MTIGFAEIAGGEPSSVSGMTAHLMNMTVSRELSKLAAYYARGADIDSLMIVCATRVGEGRMEFSEALAVLISDRMRGWSYDEETIAWVEERLSDRLSIMALRAEDDMLDAPLAVVRPDIHPMVLKGLGIEPDGILSEHEISALIAGRRSDGSLIEGKTYSVEREIAPDPKTGVRKWATPIGSYDFCPTPDKSVSVAWAFAGPAEQAQIYNAHIEAAREAVAYIASEVGQAKLGHAGQDGYEPGHVGWMEFTHYTSRRVQIGGIGHNGGPTIEDAGLPGDMNLHTHFLIPNAVFCESGRVGSLDTMAIRGFIFEADGYYHARLATKLRDAGYEVVKDERTGAARMTVIPQELNSNFSKKTNMGEALAKALVKDEGKDWDSLSYDEQTTRIKEATQRNDLKREGSRGLKDDMADFDDWKRQAKELGWEAPRSLQFIGPPERPLTKEERDRKAYEIALPFVEKKLEHRSVIPHWDLRLGALRGLIATRCDGLQDIKPVTRLMHDEGVVQQGEKTEIRYGQESGKRYTSITTKLHIDQEEEFVRLGTGAARDKSGAIPLGLLRQKMAESGMVFDNVHGAQQRNAIETVGTGGRFGVVIGVPGGGKSALLRPLVSAWDEMGRETWGSSTAWRQADDLEMANIPKHRLKAFSVLMDGIRDGSVKLTSNSVVAIDEWGQLGTKQGLDLLRAQAKYGFTIVSLGDDSQIGSIKAGAIFNLSRRVLGEDNIPEITETKRQKTEREQEIVRLLRKGEAAAALAMKREDGTAELAYGGAQGVIERVAKVYAERLEATGQAPTIGAPTNSDAHKIGEAVRAERRRMGLLGADVKVLDATDGERSYGLRLAKGDHVRLHESTRAFMGYGERRNGKKYRIERSLGRNGSVAEIVDFTVDGVRLRNLKDGKEGEVKWSAMPSKDGRMKLSYGYAWTNHISQGYGGEGHITALPGGSGSVGGAAAYTALTRHEWWSYLISSEVAERIAVQQSRPINSTHEITEDDKFANMARNFVNQKKNDSALDMVERVRELRSGTVRAFQAAMRPEDPNRPLGHGAADLLQRLHLDMLAERITHGIQRLQQALERERHVEGRSR